MDKEEINDSKQHEYKKVFEEIKSIDTSKYKSNPIVNPILLKFIVEQYELLLLKHETFIKEFEEKRNENLKLHVEVVELRSIHDKDKTLDSIRTFIGIAIGISGSLLFSKENVLSQVGLIGSIFLCILLVLTYLSSHGVKK